MTSIIIAIAGIIASASIILTGIRKINSLGDDAESKLNEAMRHEKLAVDIMQFAQELLETTSDEQRVNLIIKYHRALTEVREIENLTDKYNK